MCDGLDSVVRSLLLLPNEEAVAYCERTRRAAYEESEGIAGRVILHARRPYLQSAR